jgi:hypothetical protein
MPPAALAVAFALLRFDPARRASAAEALQMPYFTTERPRAQRPAGCVASRLCLSLLSKTDAVGPPQPARECRRRVARVREPARRAQGAAIAPGAHQHRLLTAQAGSPARTTSHHHPTGLADNQGVDFVWPRSGSTSPSLRVTCVSRRCRGYNEQRRAAEGSCVGLGVGSGRRLRRCLVRDARLGQCCVMARVSAQRLAFGAAASTYPSRPSRYWRASAAPGC